MIRCIRDVLQHSIVGVQAAQIQEHKHMNRGTAETPLNIAELEERCNGNIELVGALLNLFQTNVRESLRNLIEATKAGNLREVAAHAHRIKGGSSELTAWRITQLASQIESSAESESMAHIESQLRQLQVEFDRCDQFIAHLAQC